MTDLKRFLTVDVAGAGKSGLLQRAREGARKVLVRHFEEQIKRAQEQIDAQTPYLSVGGDVNLPLLRRSAVPEQLRRINLNRRIVSFLQG